jgi:WD40 repeat protein
MHVGSVSGDKTARVWDMHGNEVGKYLAEDSLTCVAFFPDNHHLVVGSLEKSLSIVNWRNGSLVEVLWGHRDSCYTVDVLPMSRKIVSASLDKTVIVWSRPRPVDDFSPQTESGYSIEKILAGHKVYAEACPVLHANNVRIMPCQPRGQTTKGG